MHGEPLAGAFETETRRNREFNLPRTSVGVEDKLPRMIKAAMVVV
jgi:hypothetical protein